MKHIRRLADPITQKKYVNYTSLLYIKNFPIYFGTVTSRDSKRDKCLDQQWVINEDTGNIFLKKLVPMHDLYIGKQHSAGTVGGLWIKHHENFAKFIRKFTPHSILEIGGAHGLLSLAYGRFEKLEWTIIEPDPNPAKGVQAKYIKCFIEEYTKPFDPNVTIVHSHVFEHIYKPAIFLKKISMKMVKKQKMIFSLPNITEMVKRKYTNSLNFEHTIFIDEQNIEYLLKKFGFRIIQTKKFLKDHSIFFCVEKIQTPNKSLQYRPNFHRKDQFINFVNYHHNLIDKLNKKINKHLNKNIFLFGGHIFSQFLIKLGLLEDNIIYILDNDPLKNNKRLYGTELIVKNPKILNKFSEPLIILRAGVYNHEIKKGILSINSSTKFI